MAAASTLLNLRPTIKDQAGQNVHLLFDSLFPGLALGTVLLPLQPEATVRGRKREAVGRVSVRQILATWVPRLRDETGIVLTVKDR